MSSSVFSQVGAYGFPLAYQNGESLEDLIPMEPGPAVMVSWTHACTYVDFEEVGETKAYTGVKGASSLYVDREPPTIRFHLSDPPVPGALVHPLLTIGAAILARWRGDLTLHAGAFEVGDGAWAVLGAREAGKSSLLAALAVRGVPIVADDLLTIHDGWIWSGPNCVDLRPDIAGRYTSARFLGIVGGRERYRLSTPPSRPRVPLRGMIVLGWHDRSDILAEPLTAQERLQYLYRKEYISLVGWPAPEKFVPLLKLPGWRLTRSVRWDMTDSVVDRVLQITNDTTPVVSKG